MIRKLVTVPLLLGGAFLVGNVVAERAAESALSGAAADAVGLEGDVSVDIRGFPLLLQVFQGRVDAVEVSVQDQVIQDLRFQEVHVTLRDVRAEGSILGDGPLAIRVGRSEAGATIDEEAIESFLRRKGHDVRIRVREGSVKVTARRDVLGQRRTFTATGPLLLEGRDIVFRPRKVSWDGPTFPGAEEAARSATTVRERLPRLPAGASLEQLQMHPGLVSLKGSASAQRIQLR